MQENSAAEDDSAPVVTACPRRVWRELWPMWVAFLLLAWGVGRMVIFDYGPDEPYHLAYVDSLARFGRLPLPKKTHLVQHPPVFYALMAVPWKAANVDQEPLSIPPGPNAQKQMSSSAQAGRTILRALQPFFALGSLLLMSHTLSLLRVEKKWQIVLLGFVAAWPMWGYVAGVVNNENLSILFCSLAAFLCVRLLAPIRDAAAHDAPDVPGVKQALVLGAMLGAGLLAKQTTAFCIPLGLAALWLVSGRARVHNVGLAMCGVLATGVWWPAHNWLSHGTPFPSFTPRLSFPTLSDKIAALPNISRASLRPRFCLIGRGSSSRARSQLWSRPASRLSSLWRRGRANAPEVLPQVLGSLLRQAQALPQVLGALTMCFCGA